MSLIAMQWLRDFLEAPEYVQAVLTKQGADINFRRYTADRLATLEARATAAEAALKATAEAAATHLKAKMAAEAKVAGFMDATSSAIATLAAIRATSAGNDWALSAKHFHDLAGETIRELNAARAALETDNG